MTETRIRRKSHTPGLSAYIAAPASAPQSEYNEATYLIDREVSLTVHRRPESLAVSCNLCKPMSKSAASGLHSKADPIRGAEGGKSDSVPMVQSERC